MPIRQINSPGVEIREIDVSPTSPSIVGTGVLVMGYANKGEAYNPLDIISISDLETNFGKPNNEAERYFYYACREVLNENGNLVAAKLPYSNDMDTKYKYISVSIDGDTTPNQVDLATVSGDLPEIASALLDLSSTSGTLTNYVKLTTSTVSEISVSDYDTLVAGGTFTDPGGGEFVIVNELKDTRSGAKFDEGLFVTVVDPIHGMLVQRAIAGSDPDSDIMKIIDSGELSGSTFIENLSATYSASSISENMMTYFPAVEFVNDGENISNEFSDWVTVIVSKTVSNPNQNGDLNVVIQEAWSGSLRTTAKDTSTGQSTYIGNIVNNNSVYVKWYATSPANATTLAGNIEDTDCFYTIPQSISLATFTVAEAASTIVSQDIVNDIEVVFEKLANIDDRQIDLVVDAGLSTIAQFVVSGEFNPIEKAESPGAAYPLTSSTDTSRWRAVASALDNFCKNVRKDCMTIVDVPRNLVLDADKKYIRKTAPTQTFSNTISPKLKFCTGLNSSYLAAYSNWTRIYDTHSGNNVWLPESIKTAGIYVRTDRVGNIWDAPAGLNRGVMTEVNDLAFNPRPKESDQLYTKSFNYAKQYPLDGFVLEGQKTSQVKPSAFDRVNVRRLFLRLERYVYQISRYFVMEPNNVFTRRRLVAAIEPLFQTVKSQGGLYDFRIVCDETNNPPAVIDANELKVAILLKPVRTAEFILVDFIATRTDANFDEFL